MGKRTDSTITGTVIRFEDWEGWRIVGRSTLWQLQTTTPTGLWRNYKSYPTLQHAALGAFDYAMLNDPVSIGSVYDLCCAFDKAAESINAAVTAALSDQEGGASTG